MEQLTLKRVGRWELVVAVVLVAGFGTVALISGAGSFAQRAWVNARVPDAHTLLLAATDVKIYRSGEHIDTSDCRDIPIADLARRASLTPGEVAIVCGWLKDPAIAAKVDAALAEQRHALWLLAALTTAYAIGAQRWLVSTHASRTMAQRLDRRRADAGDGNAEAHRDKLDARDTGNRRGSTRFQSEGEV